MSKITKERLSHLKQFIKDFITKNPEHKVKVNNLYIMCLEEIVEGYPAEQAIQFCIDNINELVEQPVITKEQALKLIDNYGDMIRCIEIFLAQKIGFNITKDRAKKIIEWSKSIRLLSDKGSINGYKLEIVFEDNELRKGYLEKYVLKV